MEFNEKDWLEPPLDRKTVPDVWLEPFYPELRSGKLIYVSFYDSDFKEIETRVVGDAWGIVTIGKILSQKTGHRIIFAKLPQTQKIVGRFGEKYNTIIPTFILKPLKEAGRYEIEYNELPEREIAS